MMEELGRRDVVNRGVREGRMLWLWRLWKKG